MRIAIYTSFAINYLAKARVLVDTVKAVNPAIDVVAVVCDRFPSWIDPTQERFDQIWTVDEYPAAAIKPWIFRHNIMELSTAVKGWALTRLLEQGYDYVLYLDPDCLVLEDPAAMTALLSPEHSVGVVAHTTRPADTDEEIRIIETSSLRHGIYNLGFLIVRNDDNGRRLARWWAARLDRFCVDDFDSGLFTDQRWFDLALGYFDFIKSLKHRGIDVASWNIGQREITRRGSGYSIDGDDLIFYHFSGVGPAGVHRWVRDKFAPSDPLAAELEFRYERLIGERDQARLARIRPFYDLYSDGTVIAAQDRRHYRLHPAFEDEFPDPFAAGAAGSFKQRAAVHRPDKLSAPQPEASWPDDMVERAARSLFEPDIFRKWAGSGDDDPDALWQRFKELGWARHAQGNRFFDTRRYAAGLSDAERDAAPTPFHHYFGTGRAIGLTPNWSYDDAFYLTRYPDVAEAVRNGMLSCGFEHYSLHGWREGRSGCAFFNESSYLDRYGDVADAVRGGQISSGWDHYVRHGSKEGRSP